MNCGKISYFDRGIQQAKPDQALDLSDILSMIKRPILAQKIKALRAEKDAGRQEALKRQLPYCTFSGEFQHRRRDDPSFKHSGLIVLDFDHLENVKAARAKVEKDPFVMVSFVSPRGAGLKVIVRIPADKDAHEKHFRAAAHYFKAKYNLTADESGKDYSRACFLACDPEAYANSLAPVFDAQQAVEIERSKPAPAAAGGEKVSKGSRNTAMTSLAGKLRRIGLKPGEIMAALRERNIEACDPPLEEREIEALVRSVCKYDPAKGDEAPAALETETAEALMGRSIEPIHFVVPDFLPEGLAILGGRPKIGKSWMALDLGLCCARGGEFLDKYQAEKGLVLYLALEDSDRRMKQRIEKLLDGAKPPEGFHYSTKLAQLDKGGMGQLQEWVKDHPGTKLVIIDTLGRIRPGAKKGEILYQADTGFLAPLQAFALDNHLALVAVHHQRKGAADDVLDTISGSTGLTGVADVVYVLQRETRQRADGILAIESRDFESESAGLELDKATMRWRIVGSAKFVLLSRQRDAIREALGAGPMKAFEIATTLGKKPAAICRLLTKMEDDGQAFKNKAGAWELAHDPF